VMRQDLRPGRRMIMLVLGIAFLCLVFTKYVLIPQFNGQCENKARLRDLRSNIQAAKVVAESLQYETELAGRVAEQLNVVKPLFDNVMDDGLVFVHIGLKAVESKVEIVSVVPSAVLDKGTYLEFPVRVEVCGGYLEVCNFINKIESFPNLSEIRMLKIISEHQLEAAIKELNVEIPPTQKGKVMATLDIAIYSSPSPAVRMQMKQVSDWAVGRNNAFLTPGLVSPYPGVQPLDINTYEKGFLPLMGNN